MQLTSWPAASLAFFVYLGVAALVRPRVGTRARLATLVMALVGLSIVGASRALPDGSVLNVWILPPLALLVGYWGSGLLFVAPMRWAERWLVGIDDALRVDAIARRTPRPIAELLEFAYAAVYPLIPIALFLAMRHGIEPARFWTIILVVDYICFGALPWFQTRPPRSLGIGVPWSSAWRRINARLLEASVRVNTFPSGHAAEALAVFLLLSGAPWPVAAGMLFWAMAISAGAVFGRYHYAADAIAGWAVALIVFLATGR